MNNKNTNKNSSQLNEKQIWIPYDDYQRYHYECNKNLKRNYDFSAFPILLEKTYSQMQIVDRNVCDLMPFCLYQHGMFSILNEYLLHLLNKMNPGTQITFFENISIHKSIKSYIECIQNGLRYEVINLPNAAIPQESIKDDNGKIWIPAGSFGPITAENHNSYECYASPLVSRRLIEQTIYANENDDFEPWNPLPSGVYPEGAICTSNLIGYRIPEKLSKNALNILRNIEFCNGDDWAARLCHSSKLLSHINLKLKAFNNKLKIEKGLEIRQFQDQYKMHGFVEAKSEMKDNQINLFNRNIHVHSPEFIDKSEGCMTLITGLRRKRNIFTPGYCMIKSNGGSIEGWENTMNDNFKMEGLYKDKITSIDRGELMQEENFTNIFDASASVAMDQWLTTFEKL